MAENIPDAVYSYLAQNDYGHIVTADLLTGGVANQVRRITTTKNRTMVLKQNTTDLDELFQCEAQGLYTLRNAGMSTPDVLAVGSDFLLLEDLGTYAAGEPAWEAFGRHVARQHLHTNEKFGFPDDNYLGLTKQLNPWTEDGHEFFGQYRVLRYLYEPLCEQVLTTEDRIGIEQLVARLPALIPPQQPSLLHGDLWHANILARADGTLAVIDPAVYYGWAEAELSMIRQYNHVPPVFFDAYIEINPLTEGWWDRLELLYIRELLSVTALFGNKYNTIDQLHNIIRKFS